MSKTLRDELGFEIAKVEVGGGKSGYIIYSGDKYKRCREATATEIKLWTALATCCDENKRLREAIKAFLDDYDNPEDLIPGEGLRFIDQLRKALTDHTKEKQA